MLKICRSNVHVGKTCLKYLKKRTRFGIVSKMCLVLSMFLGTSCLADTLTGQVEETGGSAPLPGTVSQNNAQTEIRVQIPANLQPATPQTDQNVQNNQLVGGTSHEISAIGCLYNKRTYIIYYIDPNSDLTGLVNLGDRFLTINGVEANLALANRTNFGNDGSLVTVGIQRSFGPVQYFQVRRHPHRYFSQKWHIESGTPY